MKINENIAALNAYVNITRSNKAVEVAMMRLSSGYKLNSVKDNPTGLAIANQLRNQVSGTDIADRNALDGVSAAQSADGALQEVTNILQRIRELSVYAATDSNEPEDRDKMQYEVEELLAELDSFSKDTEYNKIKLLAGEAARVGKNTDESFDGLTETTYVSDSVPTGDLTYTINSVGLPANTTSTAPGTGNGLADTQPSGQIMLNGEIMIFEEGDNYLEKFKDLCKRTNIEPKLLNSPADTWEDYENGTAQIMLYTREAGADQYIQLSGDEELLTALGFPPTGTPPMGIDEKGTDADVENASITTAAGIVKPYSVKTDGNKITLYGSSNEVIELEITLEEAPDEIGKFFTKNGLEVDTAGVIEGGVKSAEVDITDYGMLVLQIGANQGTEMKLQIPKINTHTLDIEYINIASKEGAQLGIIASDAAIAEVSGYLAKIGAAQNRLQYTSQNLTVASENMSISLSKLRDTDIAWEMTALSKASVMAQAGMAIIAQANQRPQQILQLLGN